VAPARRGLRGSSSRSEPGRRIGSSRLCNFAANRERAQRRSSCACEPSARLAPDAVRAPAACNDSSQSPWRVERAPGGASASDCAGVRSEPVVDHAVSPGRLVAIAWAQRAERTTVLQRAAARAETADRWECQTCRRARDRAGAAQPAYRKGSVDVRKAGTGRRGSARIEPGCESRAGSHAALHLSGFIHSPHLRGGSRVSRCDPS
jgi:hypothetical protein